MIFRQSKVLLDNFTRSAGRGSGGSGGSRFGSVGAKVGEFLEDLCSIFLSFQLGSPSWGGGWQDPHFSHANVICQVGGNTPILVVAWCGLQ